MQERMGGSRHAHRNVGVAAVGQLYAQLVLRIGLEHLVQGRHWGIVQALLQEGVVGQEAEVGGLKDGPAEAEGLHIAKAGGVVDAAANSVLRRAAAKWMVSWPCMFAG
jgi:hypothetical protein